MNYFYNVFSRAAESVLSAIGAHLTLSLGGILFLGTPVFFWGGAYGYTIAAKSGVALGLSFVIGVLVALVIGFLYAYFFPRLSNESFAVVTLASVLAVEALLFSWDSVTGGVLGIAGVPRFKFMKTLQNIFFVQVGAMLVALFFQHLVINSPFGRSLRGLRENKDALTSMGTSTAWIGQVAIMMAAVLTGVAGIFAVTRVQFLDPSLGGIVLLIHVLTIAIIANTPSVYRFITVALVIILLPELLRFLDLPVLILGYMRTLLYGLILIALLYYVVYNTKSKRYV